MGSPPALNYDSKPRPVSWRPLIWGVGICGVVLGLVAVFKGPATRYYQHLQRQQAVRAMLQLQDACLGYSIPSDMLVLDHSPTTAQTLAQPGYAPITSMRRSKFNDAAVLPSHLFTQFQDAVVALNDRNWGYNAIAHPDDGVVFMHERRTPSGQRALVVAFVYTDGAPDPPHGPWYDVRIFVMTPATLTSPPKQAGSWYDFSVSIQRAVNGVLQVHPGTPSPADPSLFVIPIRKGDETLHVHCWLTDNFTFKVRADGASVLQGEGSATVYWSDPAINPKRTDYFRGLD